MLIREYSEGSDLLIFAVPSRSDITRVAGPKISGSGNRKQIDAEVAVELLGDVASQFQVLLLVLADGNVRRLVEENVGRHQVRVGVEADRGVLPVLARLLLELRHPVEPAETGDAVEDPGELRVRGDLALVEDDVLPRIDARGQHRRGDAAACWRAVPAGPARR